MKNQHSNPSLSIKCASVFVWVVTVCILLTLSHAAIATSIRFFRDSWFDTGVYISLIVLFLSAANLALKVALHKPSEWFEFKGQGSLVFEFILLVASMVGVYWTYPLTQFLSNAIELYTYFF